MGSAALYPSCAEGPRLTCAGMLLTSDLVCMHLRQGSRTCCSDAVLAASQSCTAGWPHTAAAAHHCRPGRAMPTRQKSDVSGLSLDTSAGGMQRALQRKRSASGVNAVSRKHKQRTLRAAQMCCLWSALHAQWPPC